MRRVVLWLLPLFALAIAPLAVPREVLAQDGDTRVEQPVARTSDAAEGASAASPAEETLSIETSSIPVARSPDNAAPDLTERAGPPSERAPDPGATAPQPAETAPQPAETANPAAPAETVPPVAVPTAPQTEAEQPVQQAAPEIAPSASELATPAPASPPAEPVAPPQPPLNTALMGALENAQLSSDARAWLDDIRAFYAAREGRPLWLTQEGINSAAEVLVAEMARADEWGLDPAAFDVSGLPRSAASLEDLAAAEIKITQALLTYAWHARGGRVDPLQLSKWLDQSPRPLDVKAVLETFASTSDPSLALQKLHPQHRQFELLRQAYLKARAAQDETQADPRETIIPDGPVVRLGERHEHVTLVRRRLEVPASSSEDADLYDESVASAVRAVLGDRFRNRRTGKMVKRAAHPPLTNAARASLNRGARQARQRRPTLEQYLVNLERWRWMPESLGATYIWNNLPEFTMRVVRNERVIHQERIIIGKPTNQTPVFSDAMQFVVFHPDWGVPSTIKVQELLPALQAGDYSILSRRNMRIVNGGRTVRPSEIDWSRTDIRRLSVIQDPGPANPLGQLKFMFPNKHDVYMHDTPNKRLFDTSSRAYSFGCIRVRNPVRLAELVFGPDRGWGKSDIQERLRPRAAQNSRVDLNRRVPVHNTYFTLLADEEGKVKSFADVYGHDRRIQAVLLDGASVASVARDDPAAALERRVRALASAPPPPRQRRERYSDDWGGWGWGPPPRQRRGGGGGPADFFSGLFGN